jgi:hypothetical protein
MDPFLEGPDWPDFHHSFIANLKTALVPQVRPRYAVRVDLRVYQQPSYESELQLTLPDLSVYRQNPQAAMGQPELAADQPSLAMLPIPEEVREAFLTVRDLEHDRLVTVIELLSPTNKRSGSTGRAEYLEKREANVNSQIHIVELDLLRGGLRLPMSTALPPADYYAFVSRSNRRPRCDLYHWSLRQRMPKIPVPLANGDADAVIDLNAVFDQTYDLSGYSDSLNYARQLTPALNPLDQAWVQERLQSHN